MVNVAQGLALGGASRAFQAADERSIQREGISSREQIEQNKIQEQRRKSNLETTQAAFSGILDQMDSLALAHVGAQTDVERAEINARMLMLKKMAGQMQAFVADTRPINGKDLPNSSANPAVHAAMGSRLNRATLKFKAQELKLRARGEGALEGAKAAAAGPGEAEAKKLEETAKLEARREIVGQIFASLGLSPEMSANLSAESEKSAAVTQPFDDGEQPSADAQEYAQLIVASRALLAAGLTKEGGAVLQQAQAFFRSSREMQRLREGDKRISLALAREFGVSADTTINEFNARVGQAIPLSPEEVKRRGARATAIGKGQPGAQEKVDLIQQTQGIITGLVDEFRGTGKFSGKPNPNLFGLRGSFAKAGKQGLAVLSDLGLGEFVEQATDLVSDTLTLDQIFEMTQSPTLSALDILQNTIGIVWANVRTKTGRVPLELIRTSIAEVKLTGLRGGQQVVDRLELVSKLIGGRGASLKRAFELGGGAQPQAPQPQAAQPAAPNIPVFSIKGGELVPVQ